MKITEISMPTNKIITLASTAIMIFFLNACTHKITFMNSTVIPAARGTVEVSKDKSNNYVIKLALNYLSESSRLTPPKNTYVVWMVTENNVTKNIGQIKTSSNLKANFETKSSFKPSKIFITADDDANLQYPSTQIVLTTDNFYAKN